MPVGAILGVVEWLGRYFEGLGVPLGTLGGQSAPKRSSPDPHGSIFTHFWSKTGAKTEPKSIKSRSEKRSNI